MQPETMMFIIKELNVRFIARLRNIIKISNYDILESANMIILSLVHALTSSDNSLLFQYVRRFTLLLKTSLITMSSMISLLDGEST